jgi:N-acetylglucosaminyldiphosphoundecaprenol N-acetyl-beta-D-mannosaminyltransferase
MIPQSVHIFGVRIDLAKYDEILDAIAAATAAGRRLSISGPHYSILLQARGDEVLRATLNGCAINHPDGIGIAMAIRVLHGIRAARVNGTDLYTQLLERFPPGELRYYFLGGNEATVAGLYNNFAVPDIEDAVRARHGFDPVEDPAAADDISAAQPDILLVGMGSPRQFEWIERWQDELDVPVIIAVGGGLEFLSGRKPRAPRWMRALGLEWLHRLALEPARLWKRYIIGIPKFAWAIAAEKLRR